VSALPAPGAGFEMSLRVAGLHLLVLSAFALAQPLFDLLGKNAEFFGARGSTGWDVVLFALALVLVPPAVLLAIEAVTPRRARPFVHYVFVAALVGLLVLQAIRSLGAPGWLLVLLSAGAGAAAAAVYARFGAVRMVVTALAPVPVLFLALFLFNSDASKLTLSGTPAAQAANERPRAPVVLVVFDELPLNSLLDAHERIDRVRFPHFAKVAAGSTWFARDTTVAEGTTHAVPAILTGRYPRKGELPLYADHPQNLFTLLGDGTRLHVVDDETHLCPTSLCPSQGGSPGARAGTLAEDAGIVYLHEVLPRDLTHGIPSIANGWADFLQDSGGRHDPGRLDAAFVDSLQPEAKPSLWYVHVMLPHSPWAYLPSGTRYSLRQAPGWGADEVWSGNQAAVDQYWQRHLLQLGYADDVLGRLVARLRATGLWDRALVIVTADHGVSFRAGQKRRPLSPANLQDIAYVPLFVKRPGQRAPRVVMAPSRNTDILPTIARAVGVHIPWHVDGHALLGARPRERDVVLIKDAGRRYVVPAAALEARRESALRRQLALFGSDEPSSSLFAAGPDRGLLGRAVHGGRPVTDLDPIDRSGSLVQVSGRARGRSVIVVSNGRVVAVDPIVAGRFWALAPARGPVRVFVTR
jgi:Sulfatase